MPLTAVDVAARFQVDPRTAARWALTGVIEAHQTTTGQWLFDPAVVEAFVPPQIRPTDRGCTAGDCPRPHEGHGLCSSHLKRLRRHGDALADVPFGELRPVPERSPRRTLDLIDTEEL